MKITIIYEEKLEMMDRNVGHTTSMLKSDVRDLNVDIQDCEDRLAAMDAKFATYDARLTEFSLELKALREGQQPATPAMDGTFGARVHQASPIYGSDVRATTGARTYAAAAGGRPTVHPSPVAMPNTQRLVSEEAMARAARSHGLEFDRRNCNVAVFSSHRTTHPVDADLLPTFTRLVGADAMSARRGFLRLSPGRSVGAPVLLEFQSPGAADDFLRCHARQLVNSGWRADRDLTLWERLRRKACGYQPLWIKQLGGTYRWFREDLRVLVKSSDGRQVVNEVGMPVYESAASWLAGKGQLPAVCARTVPLGTVPRQQHRHVDGQQPGAPAAAPSPAVDVASGSAAAAGVAGGVSAGGDSGHAAAAATSSSGGWRRVGRRGRATHIGASQL